MGRKASSSIMIAVSRRSWLREEEVVATGPIHSTLPTQRWAISTVVAHLAEGDAEVGLLPRLPTVPAPARADRVRDLLGGQVHQAVARGSESHVAGDVLDRPTVEETVIDVGRLDDGHVGASELVQAFGQVGEQLGIGGWIDRSLR